MNAPNQEQFTQAIQKAQEALQLGDKRSVHHWAEIAASLSPEVEDPWLLLAAVGSPRASVAYLQRALQANPASQRAQKGLQWALNRVREEEASLATQKLAPKSLATTQLSHIVRKDPTPTQPVRPVSSLVGTQPTRVRPKTEQTQPARVVAPSNADTIKRPSLLSLGLLVFVCFIVGAFIFADITPASAFITSLSSSQPHVGSAAWGQALVQKPAQLSTPTPTPFVDVVPAVDNLPVLSTAIPSETLPSVSNEVATPEIFPTPLATDAEQAPSPTPLPTDTSGSLPGAQPSNPYTGSKFILVDISEQHLYAYDGDALVYSFVASTGMRGATRVGTFSVLDKIPNAYGSTWNIWMPDWLGIYYSGSLENGIHSLPILPSGQRLWAGYLGTPISYGCVVLGVDESRLLYDWADIGTPVTIQY